MMCTLKYLKGSVLRYTTLRSIGKKKGLKDGSMGELLVTESRRRYTGIKSSELYSMFGSFMVRCWETAQFLTL